MAEYIPIPDRWALLSQEAKDSLIGLSLLDFFENVENVHFQKVAAAIEEISPAVEAAISELQKHVLRLIFASSPAFTYETTLDCVDFPLPSKLFVRGEDLEFEVHSLVASLHLKSIPYKKTIQGNQAFAEVLTQFLNARIRPGDLSRNEIFAREVEYVRPTPLEAYFKNSAIWSFWREWYQGFLDGKPLDWELQRRVALIDDAIWEAGPEAVAEEIEKIRAKFDAERAAKVVEDHLKSPIVAQAAPANPMIGHNSRAAGEDLPLTPPELDGLGFQFQIIQEQMRAEVVDLKAINAATEQIEEAEKKAGGWLAEKWGLTVDGFFTQLGTRGADAMLFALGVGATAGVVWFLGFLQKLAPFWDAIRRVIALLAG